MYKCSKCKSGGIKLWRTYSSFHIELICVFCMGDAAKNPVRRDGKCLLSDLGIFSDNVASWAVPAVPDEDNPGAYWGYTSVPPERVQWWRSLPLWRTPRNLKEAKALIQRLEIDLEKAMDIVRISESALFNACREVDKSSGSGYSLEPIHRWKQTVNPAFKTG